MNGEPTWPQARWCLPSKESATSIVAEVREHCGAFGVSPPRAIWHCARRGGFHIVQAKDNAEIKEPLGLLIPCVENEFRIWLNMVRHDHENPYGTNKFWREIHFTIAHELAHGLFYRRIPGEAPTRAIPLITREEEDFCDAFAEAMCGDWNGSILRG